MFLRHTKEIKHYESSKKKTKLFFMLPDDGSRNCMCVIDGYILYRLWDRDVHVLHRIYTSVV